MDNQNPLTSEYLVGSLSKQVEKAAIRALQSWGVEAKAYTSLPESFGPWWEDEHRLTRFLWMSCSDSAAARMLWIGPTSPKEEQEYLSAFVRPYVLSRIGRLPEGLRVHFCGPIREELRGILQGGNRSSNFTLLPSLYSGGVPVDAIGESKCQEFDGLVSMYFASSRSLIHSFKNKEPINSPSDGLEGAKKVLKIVLKDMERMEAFTSHEECFLKQAEDPFEKTLQLLEDNEDYEIKSLWNSDIYKAWKNLDMKTLSYLDEIFK